MGVILSYSKTSEPTKVFKVEPDEVTVDGSFWEGPQYPGETGRYVRLRWFFDRVHWRNSMSREYAERHRLTKHFRES